MRNANRSLSTADGNAVGVLTARVATLERRVRFMFAASVLLASAALMASRRPADTLRVTGLVVVDAEGRERIVIGAPLSTASTDAKLAGAAWIVILDSLGRLAVAVGQSNPAMDTDGKVLRRIAKSNGINIYDPRNGAERGGMGAFASGQANMCLDYSTGKEAACASVADDDSYSAMQLHGTPNEPQHDRVGMFLGADGAGILKALGGGRTHTGGIVVGAGEGAPYAKVYDPSGKVLHDLAKVPR